MEALLVTFSDNADHQDTLFGMYEEMRKQSDLGSVSFLIAQQPELQGFNGIKALCDHLIFKKEVTCINYMPIDLLTVETIDYYHSK